MDRFWVEISGKPVDNCWLVRLEVILTNLIKSNKELSRKSCLLFQVFLAFKKMVFERFNEHLPHFQFKADFLSCCSCQCPEISTLLPH